MAQSFVAASERQDEYLDVDTYSWHECLKIIEDHEWSASKSVPEESRPAHGANCDSASFEIGPVSQDDSLHRVLPEPNTAHAAEASVSPADASGRCDTEDTSRDHPPSPVIFQKDIASGPEMMSIVSPALAESNTAESTIAMSGPEIEIRTAACDTSALATVEVAAEVSYRDIDLVDPCTHASVQLPHRAEHINCKVSDQAPEVSASTTIVEYPPTPAMSTSELQTIDEGVRDKSSPALEYAPTEIVYSNIESRISSMPPASYAISSYHPPNVTDQTEIDDEEHTVLSTSASTVPSSCATDCQIILRPPQDWRCTYMAKDAATGSSLLEHDGKAIETTQTDVATPPVTLNTQLAPILFHNSPDTPPASPDSESHKGDLTSIMAALASYSLSDQSPPRVLKRSFNSTGVEIDSSEEHATKRQRLYQTGPGGDAADAEHQLLAETSSSSLGGGRRQVSSTTPTTRFAGAYVQVPDAEMEARVTTASVSPTIMSSIPPPASPERTKIEAKAVKPSVDPTAPIKSEANEEEKLKDSVLEEHLSDAVAEEHKTESDSQESDELTEVDDEELSLLLTAMETTARPTAQDTTSLVKDSTPALVAEDIDGSEPSEAESLQSTDESTAAQSSSISTTLEPRHNAEFHYERRATRSETRTSDRGPAAVASTEPATDSASPPVVKEEASASAKKPQNSTAAQRKPTRLPTPKTAAPHPKATPTQSKPTRKPSTANKTTPQPTPRQAKSSKKTKSPPTTLSKPHTTTPTDTTSATTNTVGVLGKRKTRRTSALEGQMSRALEAERNIAKRLRSQNGECGVLRGEGG